MRSIIFCLFFSVSALLNAASSTPSFTYEIEEFHASPLEKSKVSLIPAYTVRCSDTKKNIDTMLSIDLMDGTRTLTKTRINNDGYLTQRDPPYKQFLLGFGCGYGESVTILIESTQKPYVWAQQRFVPHPLVIKNDTGVCMSCEAIDIYGKKFCISLKGLQPNEHVNFQSMSMGKRLEFSHTSDSNGEIKIKYFPGSGRNAKGTFTLRASNSRIEPLVLNHYWGKLAFTCPLFYVEPKTEL